MGKPRSPPKVGDTCLTILYKNGPDVRWDVDYYRKGHMRLIMRLYGRRPSAGSNCARGMPGRRRAPSRSGSARSTSTSMTRPPLTRPARSTGLPLSKMCRTSPASCRSRSRRSCTGSVSGDVSVGCSPSARIKGAHVAKHQPPGPERSERPCARICHRRPRLQSCGRSYGALIRGCLLRPGQRPAGIQRAYGVAMRGPAAAA